MKNKTELKFLAAIAIFGSIGLFLEFIGLPRGIVAFGRSLFGTLFVLAVVLLRGKKPDKEAIRKNLRWLILSGMSLGFNWIFLFTAYEVSSLALGILCNYLAPVLVVLIAPILWKDKLTLPKMLCVGAAFVGIVFVSGLPDGGAVNVEGIVMGLLSAVTFVFIVVFNRKLDGVTAFDKAVVQLAVATVTIFPYALFESVTKEFTVDPVSVLLVVVLGFFHTGVAYCFYFDALGKISTQAFAVIGYLEPVMAVLISAFLLGTPMTVFGWIGAVLIIGAALVGELLPGAKEK